MAESITEEFTASDGTAWRIRVPAGLSDEDFQTEAARQIQGGTAKRVTAEAESRGRGGLARTVLGAIGEALDPGGLALDLLPDPIKAAVPSTIGGAVGTALAPAAGPFGFLLPPIGAALGEAGGQLLDRGEVDPLQVGLAGATGAIPGVAGAIGKSGAIPGVAAGMQKLLQSKLGLRGEKVYEMLAPPAGTAAKLFKNLERTAGQSIMVGTDKTRQAVGALEKELAKTPTFAPGPGGETVKNLSELLTGNVGSVRALRWDVFRANMKRVGERVGALKGNPGEPPKEGYGTVSKLYGAMWDDINALAASSTASADLKVAVQAFKQELAGEQVAKYFTRAITITQGVGVKTSNVGRVITQIEHHREELEKMVGKASVDRAIELMMPYAAQPLPTAPSFGIMGGVAGKAITAATGVEWFGRTLMTPLGQTLIAEMVRQRVPIQAMMQLGVQTGRRTIFEIGPRTPGAVADVSPRPIPVPGLSGLSP